MASKTEELTYSRVGGESGTWEVRRKHGAQFLGDVFRGINGLWVGQVYGRDWEIVHTTASYLRRREAAQVLLDHYYRTAGQKRSNMYVIELLRDDHPWHENLSEGKGVIGLCENSAEIIKRCCDAGYSVILNRREGYLGEVTDEDRVKFQAILELVMA